MSTALAIAVVVTAIGLAVAAQLVIVRLSDIAVFAVWKRMIPHIPNRRPYNRAGRREEWRDHCDKHGFISWGEYLCRRK